MSWENKNTEDLPLNGGTLKTEGTVVAYVCMCL